jgi:8-oxo-dGTP diphosphatase
MPKRRLTAEAVVFDPAGRVLLVRQGRKRSDWELPGGKVKKRESLPDAIAREVLEETSVAVTPLRLIGIFHIRKERTYDFVVACDLVETDPEPCANPPETADCGFFSLDQLPQPMRPFTIQRIHDAAAGVSHPLPVELTSEQWLG